MKRKANCSLWLVGIGFCGWLIATMASMYFVWNLVLTYSDRNENTSLNYDERWLYEYMYCTMHITAIGRGLEPRCRIDGGLP